MMTQGEKTGYEGEWMTPPKLIEWLESRFGRFDLDMAASKENKICKRFFSKKYNAFTAKNWECRNGFLNPPFDDLHHWYCWSFAQVRMYSNADRIVLLCPVSIVGNKWFSEVIAKHPFTCRIELNPRVQYIPHPKNEKGFDKNGKMKNCCNGPSQIIVFNHEKKKNKIFWEKWQ